METKTAIDRYYDGRYIDRLLELKREIDAASNTFLSSDRGDVATAAVVDTIVSRFNKFRENTRLHLCAYAKSVTSRDFLTVTAMMDNATIAAAVDNPYLSRMLEVIGKK